MRIYGPGQAAGNGLMDRRLFLQRGVRTLAVVGIAARSPAVEATPPTEPWMHRPGAGFSNYGQPSAHEAGLIRWISATPGAPQNGVSWTPLHDLDGIITPSGLHFERHHNGVPDIDPAVHRLVILGAVERPLSFDLEALKRYPRVSQILCIECGGNSNAGWDLHPIQTPAGYFHGLASCSEWTGVRIKTLLEETGITNSSKWVIAEGADAFGMTVSLPLEKLLDDAFVGLYQNGEPLRPAQGYPMRLICPGWEGVTHVKWLRTLEVSDRPVMARNETARYTELQPDGKARMFTFVMDAKSLITAPSPGMHLPSDGLYEITGLAWSGRGRIAQVEVSADGGRTWANAELSSPVVPRAFTRFRIPWQWKGQSAVLQSRATDETGYVQPTRAALLEARGRHGYFHYNAIVSWAVAGDGRVSHVYPDAPAGTEKAPAAKGDPFETPWE
jgi:sulfane dehydrogenase subunit SoxC